VPKVVSNNEISFVYYICKLLKINTMAFIDIFNFKKYFAVPSDSQVARYGHVNALYTDLKITTGSVTLPTGESDAVLNTKAGVVTITDDITDRDVIHSYNIENDLVTENSIVLITVEISDETAAIIDYNIRNVANGTFNVAISCSTAADAKGIKIHFLVIN
jgi:hypothetical protein